MFSPWVELVLAAQLGEGPCWRGEGRYSAAAAAALVQAGTSEKRNQI